MHERPSGFSDGELAVVLLGEWGLVAVDLLYLPVGFGGYHWLATDAAGSRWFVTVNDLAGVYGADLVPAMETSADLARAGLDFVVAPVRTESGPAVARLGTGHGVTVFPYLAGRPAHWGDGLTPADRLAVVTLLAALHAADPPAQAPVRDPRLAGRHVLTASLEEVGGPWTGGPFAEPARRLLATHARELISALARFDALIDRVEGAGGPLAVTHGEPHPGNLLHDGSRFLLVDWDSVGMAAPERDLWSVLADGGADAAAYEVLTGRPVNQDATALYRLRWPLDDISLFLAEFRAPHLRNTDTEESFAGLAAELEALGENG